MALGFRLICVYARATGSWAAHTHTHTHTHTHALPLSEPLGGRQGSVFLDCEDSCGSF